MTPKGRVGHGRVLVGIPDQDSRKNIVPDEYKLYRAALEWDLTDPIVIETREDLAGGTSSSPTIIRSPT